MVDSDDEFTELCSKLLKRVKKIKPSGETDVPKSSTAARNKLKKPKPSGNGGRKRVDPGVSSGCERETAAKHSEPPDRDGTERRNEGLQANADHLTKEPTQTGTGEADTAASLVQPSVKSLVLERMQQFKRAVPSRMKLSTTDNCDTDLDLKCFWTALESDSAVNQARRTDQSLPEHSSLEDEGLFFCQLCQKDLTAMNSALREQHVNRCLDQDESLSRDPEPPSVPSCPLCGKPFSTEKSRATHLKRCATKLEVPAHTLLQAVQRQATGPGTEVAAGVTRAKRKAGPKQKGPPKKRKADQSGSEVEDMLVAMALSRSMQEDMAPPNNTDVPIVTLVREVNAPAKKSRRRKQKDRPAPPLLSEDPEAPLQRLQHRMSLLLSEERGSSTDVKLPSSRFWEMEEDQSAAWSRPQRGGKKCVLWESSNMVENIDPLDYYTKELNPPITPWKPLRKLLNSPPRATTPTLPEGTPRTMSGVKEQSDSIICKEGHDLSGSQKDRQALLDLAELAGEGMTLTQWNLGPSHVMDRAGRESVCSIASSGFVPSQQEEACKQTRHPPAPVSLVTLAADFKEMVNNPHLSDAQLQTDCGEVLSAHMFVLYARCPLLVEAVHTEGFWVEEASTSRVRRLLLNDVSVEAALSFLHFLYSACTDIPTQCLPHVCELARRFGVSSLIEICELLVTDPQGITEEEEEDDDGGGRAETFRELLKSMWVNEGEAGLDDVAEPEEEKMDSEDVGEGELDEIYEFAATQRRLTEEQDTEGGSGSEHELGQLNAGSEDSLVGKAGQIDGDIQTSVPIAPCLKSTNQVLEMIVPLQDSPTCLTSGNFKSSPGPALLASPMRSPVLRMSHPLKSATSVSRQLFVQSVPRKTGAPEEDPHAQHSPPRLDDSYDRMFSETCGEYFEPSGNYATATPTKELNHPVKDSASAALFHPLPALGSSPNTQPISISSLASPPNSQPHSVPSEDSPIRAQHCSQRLPGLPSPSNFQPRSLPPPKSPASSQPRSLPSPSNSQPRSLPSPSNSQSFSLHSLASPTNSQPRSLPSPTSPSCSQPRSLPSPTSPSCSQPRSLPSPTSPSCSQPCSLPSPTSPSCSQPRSLPSPKSPSCSQPRSLPSPSCSQPRSLPSPTSPTKSPPCSLHSLESSPNFQPQERQRIKPQAEFQPYTRTSTNCCPSKRQSSSSSCATEKQPEVILILSSDEEPEPRMEAKEQGYKTTFSVGIKESPASFSLRKSTEDLSRLEVSSSTDTSWLIPATPLPNTTASHISQPRASHVMSSVISQAASHDSSMSPTQVYSYVPFSKSTPKSSSDLVTSKLFPSVHITPELRKLSEVLSSFGSKGSHVPSSLPTSPASSSVFEVGDGDNEEPPMSKSQPETSHHSFYMDYEPPIHVENEVWFNGEETPPRRPVSSPEMKTPSPRNATPAKSVGTQNSNALLGERPPKPAAPEAHQDSAALHVSRQSFLNSQLWDEWEESEGDELPAILPLSDRLKKVPDNQKDLRTPVSMVRRRELPPKVPITPLPDYSDMGTPDLKKELNRFGVRALPKKQMVLKLKEIFKYTHQVMNSDSEDEAPASQLHQPHHSSTSQGLRPPGGSKGHSITQAKRAKKPTSVCTAQEAVAINERPLTASQESTTSSAAASDSSSLSQSSAGNEFETAFADDDDDDEEPVAASQQASREAATTETVRRFIEDRPELHRRILLYQPLDLGAVQAELKQNGIKMAAGKLLDFLDSHCVTFTTATTRKEKKVKKIRGRKKGTKRY
ncbi:structure-specific endonuclease subunit SLX4 [Pelodytes ibericus]